MEKIPCTISILTFNSAATLRRTLASVTDFAEVLICDGGSTDETLTIAREYGAKIISQNSAFQNENGVLADYAGARNQCLAAAAYDWFFYIDSDEVITPELAEEIRAVVGNPASVFFIYNVSPRIVLDGRLIEHSSNYPGWQKRFFNRRSGAHFRKAIHERIEYDTTRYPEGFLQRHWHYFISSELDREKYKKYVRMDALQYRTRATRRFLHLAESKILTIGKVALKSIFNRFWYGPKTSMPLALEFRRISYQWHLLGLLYAAYLGKDI